MHNRPNRYPSIACFEAKDKTLFVPVNRVHEKNIEKMLDEHHVGPDIPLIAINPGASCPSKRWSAENFASLGDKLSNKISSSSGRGKTDSHRVFIA